VIAKEKVKEKEREKEKEKCEGELRNIEKKNYMGNMRKIISDLEKKIILIFIEFL